MRVDHVLQFCEIGGRRTAFQIDDTTDSVEARADSVFHREESAQIERTFKIDRNAFERDASAVA